MEYITKRIQIDGVDKTGKDLLMKYIVKMSNNKYVIQARGIVSQIAYSRIYQRPYNYDLEPYKHDVIILLYADLEDLKIRHKITNEPKIDIENDAKVFASVAYELLDNGLDIHFINTSMHTPFESAKMVLDIIKKEEKTCSISQIKE